MVFLCYAAATGIGVFIYNQLHGVLWFKLLAADIAATLLIWVVSLLIQNASLYDPYWSVQPIVILTLLLIKNKGYDIGSVLICSTVLFWGIRLTANWAYTFHGLDRQDWRYDLLKERSGRLFQLVNLTGIQLMPTFIVYLCLLPAAYYIELNTEFSPSMMIGVIISILAATLQMIADLQLHKFRSRSLDRSKIIRTGLWKYSRHPNYLGEILMWWGVYLTFLSMHQQWWYLGLGALANTLLFLFISIPLAEKHLAGYKAGYEEYKAETRILLPIPKNLFVLKRRLMN